MLPKGGRAQRTAARPSSSAWVGLDSITNMTKNLIANDSTHQPIRPEWRSIVESALQNLGGEADLSALYAAVKAIAPSLTAQRRHWQAKVRQVVQRDPAIERVSLGVWRLRSRRARTDDSTRGQKAA